MDKTPWFVGQIVNSYDLNNMPKDAQKGLAWACLNMLGNGGTVVGRLPATQTVTPSLSIQIGAGEIYAMAATDANPLGTFFGADTTQIMQQGHTDAFTLSLSNATSGLSSGQERVVLIQAEFEQRLIVRPGDPLNGRRAFYNSAAPANPLDGIDGLGGLIPTCNQGRAKVTTLNGTVAAAGFAAAPAPSSGCVPLYQVTVSYGQTAITTGQIVQHPDAPFLAGMLNSHHKGLPGHAPKIQLGGVNKEVQGIIDLVNTPATYTGGGLLANMQSGTANPNGSAAGGIGSQYLQTTNGQLWICTVSGGVGVATWVSIGTFGISFYVNSFPFSGMVAGNNTYQCDTSAGAATVNMLTAASMGGTGVTFSNVGTNILYLQPATGERIFPQAVNAPMAILPGNSIILSSRTAFGWYISSTQLKYLPISKSSDFVIAEPSGTLFLVTATSANITGTLPVSTGDGTVYKATVVTGPYGLNLVTSGGQTIKNGGKTDSNLLLPSHRTGVAEIVAIPGGYLVT